jgi:hypothetical protein
LGGWLVNVGNGVWFLSTFIGVNDMNKQLKKLVVQAGFEYDAEMCEGWIADNEHIERFAELVRQDERKRMAQEYNPYEIGKLLQKEGYGISDIGIRVKCDADIEQALQGYCDQIKV